MSKIVQIQKPYSITPNGSAIPAEEDNKISWQVSGAIQTKFDITITYNNNETLKLPSHGLAIGDLIIDTTQDSTLTGIRSVTVLDSNNISVSSISNLTIGDSIDKFNIDTNVTATADAASTTTQINVPNTGSIVAGDIIQANGEYRFVSSVVTNTSITVSTAFSSTTASQNIAAWHKSGTQTTEYPFQLLGNSSYNLYYTLPTNTIINGQEFQLLITIYDDSNNSATSDPVVFSTSSRPVVTVNDVGTVNSSSFNFTANYSQAENTSLKSYMAILYNSSKVNIDSSDLLTTTPLQYRFSNLQNEETYYIEFQATSSKGLTATSGLLSFNVSYIAPNVSVNLTAENVDNAGIKLSMNVIQIIANTTGITSFPDNTNIDVTSGSVYFDNSFSVDKDFSLKLWIKSPKSKTDLMIIKGSNGTLALQYDVVDRKFHLIKTINGIIDSWSSEEVFGDKYLVTITNSDSGIDFHAEVSF